MSVREVYRWTGGGGYNWTVLAVYQAESSRMYAVLVQTGCSCSAFLDGRELPEEDELSWVYGVSAMRRAVREAVRGLEYRADAAQAVEILDAANRIR